MRLALAVCGLASALALTGCASGSTSEDVASDGAPSEAAVAAGTGTGLSFNPSSTYSLSDPSAGANADIVGTFNIPAPDAIFKDAIFFTPPEWGITAGSDVPDGAIVGRLEADVTLGLIGLACRSSLNIEFTLLDAAIDPGATIPFLDPDLDRATDRDDQFDAGSDGLPLGVTLYPDYLKRIFPGQTPMARAYGQITVAGIDVSINILTFQPETPLGQLVPDPSLGYPSVVVLDATGDPATIAAPGPISDLCTPFETTLTLSGVSEDNPETSRDEGGYAVRTNPGTAGVYNFVTYARSQHDADGDGIENALDTCLSDPNVGSPRVANDGDADGDGLDAACDPNDNETNTDQDSDLYQNRHDNCPLDPNGEAQDNQRDADGDDIGDACDPNPNDPDGLDLVVCLASPVAIGGGVASNTPPELCRRLEQASH